jgi:hypothetical protein
MTSKFSFGGPTPSRNNIRSPSLSVGCLDAGHSSLWLPRFSGWLCVEGLDRGLKTSVRPWSCLGGSKISCQTCPLDGLLLEVPAESCAGLGPLEPSSWLILLGESLRKIDVSVNFNNSGSSDVRVYDSYRKIGHPHFVRTPQPTMKSPSQKFFCHFFGNHQTCRITNNLDQLY